MWKKLLKMWKSWGGDVEKIFGVWKTMWKKCGKVGGKVREDVENSICEIFTKLLTLLKISCLMLHNY